MILGIAAVLAKCGLFIAIGIVLGHSAVWAFNRMPAVWLCDYGQAPGEKEISKDRQRIASHPYRAVFSAVFAVLGIRFCFMDPFTAVPLLAVLWILLEIALADRKYTIIPDQLLIFLMVMTIGFIPTYASWKEPVYGLLAGGGVMLCAALLGRLAAGRKAVGFGDVKLFAALGMICGFHGILVILAVSSVLNAVVYVVRVSRDKAQKGKPQPLAPSIFVTAALFFTIFGI